MARPRTLVGLLLLVGFGPLASSALAQDPGPAARQLEQLIEQLRRLPPKAWQSRLAGLEAQVRAHEAEARRLQGQAAAATAKAQAARAELDRLRKVMAILAPAQPAATPAKAPPAKPPAGKQTPARSKPVPRPAAPPAAGKAAAKAAPAGKAPGKPAPAGKAMAKATPKKAPTGKPTAKATGKTAPVGKATAKATPKKAPAGKAMAKATPKKAPPGKPTAKATRKPAPTGKAIAKATPAGKAGGQAPTGEAAGPRTFVTYDDHVQDIFMENCSACHDPEEKEGGLDLTTFATARAGGSSGSTIVPGDLDSSRLYQLVAHLDTPTMPPDEPPIKASYIALIKQWILDGAPASKADAAAFARQRKTAAPKAVLRPRFDGPPPVPKDWAAVAVRPANRPVGVTTLATSPRAALLAIPGQHQVVVLDSASHRQLGVLEYEHGQVEVLRFSADGSRLLAAGGTPGKRGRAVLYNVTDGKPVGTYGKDFDSVIAAAVRPDLSQVAIGGSSRRVRVFDTATGRQLYEIKGHNEWVLGVDYSSDGKYLVSVDRGGVIVVSLAASGRNVDTIRRHRGAVYAVRFAPGTATYATVGEDRTLRLFAVQGARQITQRSIPATPTSVAFSPDGKSLAVGCQDGRARTFGANGAPLATLAPVGDWIYAVTFDAGSGKLFVGDWNGTTSAFDLKSRQRVAQLAPTRPRSL